MLIEQQWAEDVPAELRLISSVVGLAIRDATLPPHKGKRRGNLWLDSNASSAFDFLFTESCEGYLDFLDVDVGSFRIRLLKIMNDLSKNDRPFSDMQRRNFRINYKLWSDLHDRLGGRVSDDEKENIDDSEFDELKEV